MKQGHIIVVGGGHAGVEAATASARMGVDTTLITMRQDDIGTMSCNPAMGGVGKGHLIREIDAMGGVMGVASDAAGIQYRLLNRRKGPAVRGPRAQIDRKLYRAAVQSAVALQNHLRVVEGVVDDLVVVDGKVSGVILADGRKFSSDAVILTTGTFLNGVLHIGHEQKRGGRMGDDAALPLSERLYALELPMGRLKTGTPPRLDGKSIDWDAVETQDGDEEPEMLSFMSKAPFIRQVNCGITHTNSDVHGIVQENLSKSAMYGGAISGKGPRYCPSIEDKVVRFAVKNSHQIFLEPEGLDDDTVYPNGISTSLPLDIQTEMVRSIRGLTDVDILKPGYAVEYDYVDPRALGRDLQLRELPRLYLAGQINGTTGYEEAGAQGLYAGINAASSVLGLEGVHLGRTESYLGVMIDDLITKGVSEPYRMFTSRAEFRLRMRADNADQRLTPRAISLGLIGEARREAFARKSAEVARARQIYAAVFPVSMQLKTQGISAGNDGKKRSILDLLGVAGVDAEQLNELVPAQDRPDRETLRQVAKEAVYEHYIVRQEKDIDRIKREDHMKIPKDLDFCSVKGLSNEAQSILLEKRPSSVGEAGRLEGVTPVAINALILGIRRFEVAVEE